jgi:hypothetical protein
VAGRARESALFLVKIFSSHRCLSALVPAFAEPDIHLLPRAGEGLRRRLSWCSLPVPKQSVESLKRVLNLCRSLGKGWDLAVCALYDLDPWKPTANFGLDMNRSETVSETFSKKLSGKNLLSHIQDPAELQRAICELAKGLREEVLNFRESPFGRAFRTWAPFSIGGLLTMVAPLVSSHPVAVAIAGASFLFGGNSPSLGH